MPVIVFPDVTENAFGYFTPDDDTTRVVYRGTDNHIHELFLAEGHGWNHADLSLLSGAPDSASDPMGQFTALDSTARVVYRGADNHIHELFRALGHGWTHADLSGLSGASDVSSRPFGYFTPDDNTTRVVYRGTDNHIHELFLGGGAVGPTLTCRG